MSSRVGIVLAACVASSAGTQAAQAAVPAPQAAATERVSVPERLSREDLRGPIDRAVAYLVATQEPDGHWGTRAPGEALLELGYALDTYYAWQVAGHALVCMALAAVPETEERRAALEAAVDWLCTTDIPTRGEDWDIDHIWSALYGFVACVELLDDPRLAEDPWRGKLERRGKAFFAVLERHQALSGGWAYYDDPPFMRTPTWATSFCTALVLPPLLRAKELGWGVDDKVVARAERYIRRCQMPGGAYSYDLTPIPRVAGVEHINLIEGSLGRTQVCNWALRLAGVESVTDDVIREGLDAFFRLHGFLDDARTLPIPHESYFANAGYFYFFAHYYAARVINLLPAEEREEWHARLRPHLVKTQWENGATSDFLDSTYLINASTSYMILSLSLGLGEQDS